MANGQKDDAFVTLDFGSKKALKDVVVDDSIGSLFMSESDGSSHPNGGLRATQTAAAYMVLDRSSVRIRHCMLTLTLLLMLNII